MIVPFQFNSPQYWKMLHFVRGIGRNAACAAFMMAMLLLSACTQTPVKVEPEAAMQPNQSSTENVYKLWGAINHDFSSKHTERDYQVTIRLPNGYENTTHDYPVVYVLDAQWQFPMIYTMAGALWYDGDMPDVILVGIAWKDLSQRNKDLTPIPTEFAPDAGEAELFQQFFSEELFPFVEDNYRASKKRVVTGGSSSALFVFHTLLTAPDLFYGYIGTSPSVGWGDNALFDILDMTPQNLLIENKRALIAWGEYEEPFGFAGQLREFSNAFKNKQFKNLTFVDHLVTNSGHAGVNAEAYTRGLQLAFRKPQIQLPMSLLGRYAGLYRNVESGNSFELVRSGSQLSIHFKNEQPIVLSAADEKHLYVRGAGIQLQFDPDFENNQKLAVNFHANQSVFIKDQ